MSTQKIPSSSCFNETSLLQNVDQQVPLEATAKKTTQTFAEKVFDFTGLNFLYNTLRWLVATDIEPSNVENGSSTETETTPTSVALDSAFSASPTATRNSSLDLATPTTTLSQVPYPFINSSQATNPTVPSSTHSVAMSALKTSASDLATNQPLVLRDSLGGSRLIAPDVVVCPPHYSSLHCRDGLSGGSIGDTLVGTICLNPVGHFLDVDLNLEEARRALQQSEVDKLIESLKQQEQQQPEHHHHHHHLHLDCEIC